jgi:hypothetical protein
MRQIVVPVSDDSDASQVARELVSRYRSEPVRIHLLNVQRPLPRHISQFFSGADLRDFHREAGMRVIARTATLLDDAGVAHQDHVIVGKPAETIVEFAAQHDDAEVMLDEEPRSLLGVLGLGSIGSQVRRLMLAHAAVATGSDSIAIAPGRDG